MYTASDKRYEQLDYRRAGHSDYDAAFSLGLVVVNFGSIDDFELAKRLHRL